MGRVTAIVAMSLLVALAGCADSGAPNAIAVPESAAEVEVTASTGALRGIVIDETIAPIADVTITITGLTQTTTSAQDGGFSFSGLEPGDYFISAAKPGYTPIQASGNVVAGDSEPPMVKILMTAEAGLAPLVELQEWRAFLQCGVGVPMVGSVNPCLFTGSDNVHYFPFNDGASFGQAEAIWSGTQPAGNDLAFEFGGKDASGASPLLITLTGEELEDRADDNEIMVRIFAGYGPTLVVNQAYDVYVLYFYNMVPREGYRFVVDGLCDPPTSCQ